MTTGVDKESFIDKISCFSKEQLNEFIKQNGKPQKPFSPIIFLKGNYTEEQLLKNW